MVSVKPTKKQTDMKSAFKGDPVLENGTSDCFINNSDSGQPSLVLLFGNSFRTHLRHLMTIKMRGCSS